MSPKLHTQKNMLPNRTDFTESTLLLSIQSERNLCPVAGGRASHEGRSSVGRSQCPRHGHPTARLRLSDYPAAKNCRRKLFPEGRRLRRGGGEGRERGGGRRREGQRRSAGLSVCLVMDYVIGLAAMVLDKASFFNKAPFFVLNDVQTTKYQ